MSAVIAAAVGGLALSGYEVYSGEKQKSAANKLAKQNQFKPEEMPADVGVATQLAARNYTNGMPGMDAAKDQIARNQAGAYNTAVKGATSGGDLADSANKEQYASNTASQALALQAASYKSNALGGYEAALGNEAQWQDKLYNNNELQPYLRTANTAASMYGAAQQNIYNGLNSGIKSIDAGLSGINSNLKSKQLQSPQSNADNPSVAAYTNWLNFSTMGGNTMTYQ